MVVGESDQSEEEDDEAEDAPPISVVDRRGVHALLPPADQNIVPETSVIAAPDRGEFFWNLIGDQHWTDVDQ